MMEAIASSPKVNSAFFFTSKDFALITSDVVARHSEHEAASWAALQAWRAGMDSWHALEEALEEAGAPPGTRQEANESYRAAWRQFQAEYHADMRLRPLQWRWQGATDGALEGLAAHVWSLRPQRN